MDDKLNLGVIVRIFCFRLMAQLSPPISLSFSLLLLFLFTSSLSSYHPPSIHSAPPSPPHIKGVRYTYKKTAVECAPEFVLSCEEVKALPLLQFLGVVFMGRREMRDEMRELIWFQNSIFYFFYPEVKVNC